MFTRCHRKWQKNKKPIHFPFFQHTNHVGLSSGCFVAVSGLSRKGMNIMTSVGSVFPFRIISDFVTKLTTSTMLAYLSYLCFNLRLISTDQLVDEELSSSKFPDEYDLRSKKKVFDRCVALVRWLSAKKSGGLLLGDIYSKIPLLKKNDTQTRLHPLLRGRKIQYGHVE